MRTWRTWVVLFILIGLFSGLIYRLYQIQIRSTHSFSVAQKDLIALAEKVQSREVILDSRRGSIFDRNGIPIVGQLQWRLFVFPQSAEQLDLRREQWSQLSSLLHISYQTLKRQLILLKRPSVLSSYVLTKEQVKKIESLHIPGIVPVESDNRMTEGEIAKQVVGRIIRNSYVLKERYPKQVEAGEFSLQSRFGMTGLEYTFERFLHGEGESLVRFVTDGRGKALNGVQVKMTGKPSKKTTKPKNIVTTLDINLQTQVEKIMKNANVKEGAVVVQEIATGNILSMAGISASKDESLAPWINEALVEATPGSIFKTVVTIAALEEGIVKPDSTFVCKGNLNGKYQLRDADGKVHGKQTLTEAYANSCNIVLGSVAERLGGAKLLAYAKRLGLAQKIGWSGKFPDDNNFSQLPEESTGLIYAKETSLQDKGAAVQTGIGQRDVKITPLQAANMITALFHRGMPIQPRLVTEIQDHKGKVVWKFTNKYVSNSKPLKPSTINAVKKMMRMVVTKGTARSLARDNWQLSGKTGTAQVGADKSLYNKWMIGFAPYSKPQYAVSVVIKNVGDANDTRAKKIYKEVMDVLRNLNKRKSP
ncbi:peptidoglycan D,D-transpeptidase FtsI family protein [Shimazuella kribbensis]|uniref:peptidoglycan D,D-transpeptidase FtsI family protein n=1 Tax=Shimazuella kribbensis TaxID=139808 RepID=UPI0004058E1E|nr:penicillin-binding transpeptidase domain-containing protein [Shimazuella kribbensis]